MARFRCPEGGRSLPSSMTSRRGEARGQRAAVGDGHQDGPLRPGTSPAAARRRPGRWYGARLPVGSSASTRAGLWTRARATAARCLSPPDSSAGRCSRRWPRPTRSSRLRARASIVAASPTPARQGTRDVLQHVQLRQEVVVLEDEADGAAAERRQGLLVEREGILAVHPHGAGGRRVQGAEDVEQGRFAATRRPHDGEGLAGGRRRGRRRAARATGPERVGNSLASPRTCNAICPRLLARERVWGEGGRSKGLRSRRSSLAAGQGHRPHRLEDAVPRRQVSFAVRCPGAWAGRSSPAPPAVPGAASAPPRGRPAAPPRRCRGSRTGSSSSPPARSAPGRPAS